MFDRQLPRGIDDFRHEEGAPSTGTRRHRKIRAFTISEDAYAGLQLLARVHNDHPDYGKQNSTSDLLERIGSFELVIIDPKKAPKLAQEKPGKEEFMDALRQQLSE